MKIVLDAMGGDLAPQAPVMGAVQAAKDFGAQITLVGRGEEILKVLTGKSLNAKNQSLVSTPISYNGDKEYNPESNTSTMMSAEAVEMLNLTYPTDGENVLSDGNGVVKGA